MKTCWDCQKWKDPNLCPLTRVGEYVNEMHSICHEFLSYDEYEELETEHQIEPYEFEVTDDTLSDSYGDRD